MASHHRVPRIDEQSKPRPIDRVLFPFHRFFRIEASGGILLLACAAAGVAWANSPWAQSYHDLWHATLTVGFEGAAISKSLLHWINDGLMVLFFFVVGMEIKREVLVGELASLRRAAIPMAAAVGGMIVPAGIYVAINWGTEGIDGWGVPMATDIAFALGVLALVGRRVPLTLRVFLASLAIVDDIGALLVIALFYTEDLKLAYVGGGGIALAVMAVMNVAGVRRTIPYVVVAAVLWLLILKSGVHATIAGVLGAMVVPVRARVDTRHFIDFSRHRLGELESSGRPGASILISPEQQAIVGSIEDAAFKAQTPLQRLEELFLPWSAFLVIPIFALANAGVGVSGESLVSAASGKVSIGIALGLLVGKPVGVVGATWLAVRTGLGQLPTGVTWRHVLGAGFLAGIGFTMALFIAGLAFGQSEQLDQAKMAILGASLVAGIAGWAILATGPRRQAGGGEGEAHA